ncbi:hypothetical protein ACOMHN_049572 [Nucella lapillus]
MGKPKLFRVAFANGIGVFYSGQTVAGTFTLELEEPLSVRSLRLEFKGQATVHWTETKSSGKSTHTVTYHNEEHYFQDKVVLWTKEKDGGGADEMGRGLYNYPFSFVLPQGIPSSFEGGHTGHVRYVVKGVIDRRFRFDYTVQQPFTVIRDLDLNQRPDAVLEMTHMNHKFLCCLCCKSGPITASLRIPRKGYVPGETIPVDAEIENLSGRTMAKTTAKILQRIDYHAVTKTRTLNHKVAEIRHGEIGPGGSDQYHAERLLVPAVPPSFLEGCRIIDIRYYLQVEVDPTGVGFDLLVPVEIIIGTVPLRQVMEQYQTLLFPTNPAPSAPTRDELYSSPFAGPSLSSVLPPARPPPPGYSESVFGKTNLDNDNEGEGEEGEREPASYAPVYTYYNWGFKAPPTAER